MIHLVESNQTERLLEALARDVAARRAAGSHPLEPVDVVVPNRNMETYVRFGLAQALGVAANVRFQRLQPFVDRLLAEAGGSVRVVDGDRLRAWLLDLLMDEGVLDDPALAPVRRWLGEGPDAAARGLRAVQLSRRLAELFAEYDLSRQEMLAAWQHGPVLGESWAELEGWQRALWLRLMGPGGMAERHPPAEGTAWAPLHVLAAEPSRLPRLERPVFVFGVSYVARVFQAVLHRFGEQPGAAHVYVLNPCREFWEDVLTPREARAEVWSGRGRQALQAIDAGDDPFAPDAGENRLLGLWGRPGRESILLLHELSGWDFEDAFSDDAGNGDGAAPSLLQRLQRDIGRREAGPAARDAEARATPEATADRSLRLVQAPGVRREVEWVADEIWRLVTTPPAEGPPLRFSDIAVLVNAADRDLYYPHLEAVFSEVHEIPRSVVDLPMGGQSRVLEGARLLLEVPFGAFTRADVLRLLAHPSVLRRWPDAGPGDAARAAESLGIHRGRDRSDLEDTYVEKDLHTWDQGVRRAVLGAYVAAPAGGAAPPVQLEGERYLPAEHPGPAATRLALLARALLEESRVLRSARRPLSAWADFFHRQLEAWLYVGDDDDRRDLDHALGAVDRLRQLEVAERAVPGEVAAALVREHLAGLTMSRGTYLAEGVVVSSFLPMRAIPFRAVFVLGLGEGRFPAASRRDALDLREAGHVVGEGAAAKLRPGRAPRDVLPSERDRYTFLEALLCTRERLHVSWVARDETTGEPIAPSAVVQELQDVLETEYVSPECLRPEADRLVHRVPLRRFDDPESFAPSAAAERAARAAGEAVRAALARGDAAERPARVLSRLSPESRERVRGLLGLDALEVGEGPPAASMGEPEVAELTKRQLEEFLLCPLQGAARATLGLHRHEDEDAADVEEEPFTLEDPERTVVLREALYRGGGGADAAAGETLSELAFRLELAGRMPTGVVGDVDRAALRRILEGWAACTEAEAGVPLPLRRLAFGRAREGQRVDVKLPPVVLEDVELGDGARGRVEIGGQTELLSADEGASLVLTKAAPETVQKPGRFWEYAVRGLVDALLLAAAGRGDAAGHRVFVLTRPKGGRSAAVARCFPPLTPEAARAHLRALVEDLLAGPHDYVLPAEAVAEAHGRAARKGEALTPEAVLERAREIRDPENEPRRTPPTHRGPVPRAERYRLPSVEEVQRILDRRFPLLIEAREVS